MNTIVFILSIIFSFHSFADEPVVADEARIIQLISPYSYSQNESPYFAIIYEVPSTCYTSLPAESEMLPLDNLVKVTVPLERTSETCSQQIRIESKTIKLNSLPMGYYRLIANRGRSAVFFQITAPELNSYAQIDNFLAYDEGLENGEVELIGSVSNSCEYLGTPESRLSQRILTISALTETVYDSTCEIRETRINKVIELPYESKEFRNIAIKRANDRPLFAYRDFFTDEWIVIP